MGWKATVLARGRIIASLNCVSKQLVAFATHWIWHIRRCRNSGKFMHNIAFKMHKRYEPMTEFGLITKKPKLDKTSNKGKPIPSQYSVNQRSTTTSSTTNVHQQSQICSMLSIPTDFWDDDDNEFMLAAQVSEIQAAASSRGRTPLTISPALKESEITFSEFGSNLHAATSTQRCITKPTGAFFPDSPGVSDFLNDNDDEVFALLTCEGDSSEKPKEQHETKAPTKNIIKQAAVPVFGKDSLENQKMLLESTGINSILSVQNAGLPSSQSAARRQLASERQIKFLMERVDALKKESMKFQNDLAESKTKIESKEGEVSLLRDELRHMKQQVQSLKTEKIFSAEAARSECQTKISELSKQVEAKQTELQLKTVECSVLKCKMRHADETKRIETTMRSENTQSMIPQNLHPTKKQLGILKCLTSLRLKNYSAFAKDSISSLAEPPKLPPVIFENAHDRGMLKTHDKLFHVELEKLQIILAQLELIKTKALTTITREHLTSEISSLICKVFSQFWTYVHSLSYSSNCRIHPYHGYDLLSEHTDVQRESLHQVRKLYADESALSLRRFVSCLSEVCRQLPMLNVLLLRHQHGEYMLLQIAIDAINLLGFSYEVCAHFGLLEAFSMLLLSILETVECNDVDDRSAALLVALLKSLIFCRPSPWVFRGITNCILQCTQFPQMLPLLCVNSDPNTFTKDLDESVHRFSMESCLLQVYSGLLEVSFPLHIRLHRKHFNLLAAICEQHVSFIFYCFDEPPKFIHDNLPTYEDDDDDDDDENESKEQQLMDVETTDVARPRGSNNNQNVTADSFTIVSPMPVVTKNTKCECYSKLCLSLVTLLFQLLQQWKYTERKFENCRVERISKMAVRLLHKIFCDNDITRLFREADETTIHYLNLICKWWLASTDLLHFNEIDLTFLHKLQSSHIILSEMYDEENNVSNGSIDLAEWNELTNLNEIEYVGNFSTSNIAKMLNDLKLVEAASDENKFFEGLKGYAFNFE